MRTFWHWQQFLYEGEGSGGGGGGTGDGGGSAIAAAAAAAAKEAGAGEAYYPEGLGDNYRGANDRETIDKLFTDLKGRDAPTPYHPEGLAETLRGANDRETIDKLTADVLGRPKPPEKAADYKLELSEDFTKKFGAFNDKDNQVLDVLRETAHELKLDQATFNAIVPGFYEKLDKAGLLEVSDPAAEMEKLVASQPKGLSHADKLTRVAKLANDTASGVKTLEANGVLSKAQAVLISSLLDTAEGIGAVNAILGALGEKGAQPGNGSGGKQLTDHERSMRAMYPSIFKQ
ncbi:conserved protein of unknown function [Hyphomicrobium sp. 1Nfss2.1]|uniref:hypothetical protein n=1 Tax=Hyphomicrobium sp. 1Nfss2.1 TaxID=3413936 RepID=UPI003C7D9965